MQTNEMTINALVSSLFIVIYTSCDNSILVISKWQSDTGTRAVEEYTIDKLVGIKGKADIGWFAWIPCAQTLCNTAVQSAQNSEAGAMVKPLQEAVAQFDFLIGKSQSKIDAAGKMIIENGKTISRLSQVKAPPTLDCTEPGTEYDG